MSDDETNSDNNSESSSSGKSSSESTSSGAKMQRVKRNSKDELKPSMTLKRKEGYRRKSYRKKGHEKKRRKAVIYDSLSSDSDNVKSKANDGKMVCVESDVSTNIRQKTAETSTSLEWKKGNGNILHKNMRTEEEASNVLKSIDSDNRNWDKSEDVEEASDDDDDSEIFGL